MSELINNSKDRKEKLKGLILKLHNGASEEEVKLELLQTLKQIPYGEVVEVEQELIGEGLPEEEILRLCDAHSSVLEGKIDLSGIKIVPEGHPVEVMKKENAELKKVTADISAIIKDVENNQQTDLKAAILKFKRLV